MALETRPMRLESQVRRTQEQALGRRARTPGRPVSIQALARPGMTLLKACGDLRASRAGWHGTPPAAVLDALSSKADLFVEAAGVGRGRFPLPVSCMPLTEDQKRGLRLKLRARAQRGQ
jgi:hypothetical protein